MLNKILNSKIMSASQLGSKNIPQIEWLIEKILPKGLTIVAGRPKVGKSFLTLNIACTISEGLKFLNKYPTKKRKVLLVTNEDSERRIKNRLSKIKYNKDNLLFYFEPFQFSGDFEEPLKNVLQESKIDFVIIDTLVKAIKMKNSKKNQYYSEYEIFGKIQDVCRKLNIGIILVHHTRKAHSDHDIDKILGTTGISGAVDTVWILEKQKPYYFRLAIQGKDVNEIDLSIKSVGNIGNFIIDENYNEYNITPERTEILDLFGNNGKTLTTGGIADLVGKSKSNISNMLVKMVEDGLLEKTNYGQYRKYNESNETSESGEESQAGGDGLNEYNI